jgi:ABC-2 type transport system ATP-binding protein
VPPIIEISHLSKVYASGFRALDDVNLAIERGEIFALLGRTARARPRIHVICGIVNPVAAA